MTFGDYWFQLIAGDNAKNISVEYGVGTLMVMLCLFGVAFLILRDDHRKLARKEFRK